MLDRFSPRHLRVSLALWIVPAIPLFVAACLSAWLIWERQEKLQELRLAEQLSAPVVLLSNAVHEQQKERGASSVVLGSGGLEMVTQLAEQRLLTDARQAELLAFLDQVNWASLHSDLGPKVAQLRKHLQGLSAIRQGVDGLTLSAADALAYYTAANSQMLALIHEIAKLSTDHEVAVAINGFFNFLEGKERAGIERAVGSFGFAQGQFTLAGLLKLEGLVTAQGAYFRNFVGEVGPEFIAAYEDLLASDEAQFVAQLRRLAFEEGLDGDISAYQGADYFDAMTAKIDMMQVIEIRQGQAIGALMVAHQNAALSARNTLVGFSLLGGVFVVLFTLLVASAIRGGFMEVRHIAQSLSEGEYDVAWPQLRRNEFGSILQTLGVLRDHSVANKARAEQDLRDAEAKSAADRRARAEEAEEASRLAREEREAYEIREAEAAAEREITSQIAAMVASCAEGEFDQRLSVDVTSPALQKICDGMNEICKTVEFGLEEISLAMGAMARGDMTHRMTRTSHGAFGRIQTRINETADALAHSFMSVQHSSETIEASAKEIASASQDLASRTEQSAMKLEQTSNAIKSLSTSVSSTAQTAGDANAEAAAAMEKVKAGDSLVGTTIDAIREIKNSSTAIGTAIQLIDDITFQTNLLALNAGVEAARAGEAGRGFAVVASEVRDLAQRSATAAREISDLVNASEAQVDRGVTLIDQTGEALKTISGAVSGIVGQIEEIAEAAKDQSKGIADINEATSALDQVTQHNAAMFEEASANSAALRSEAENLARILSQFDLGSEGPNPQSARQVA